MAVPEFCAEDDDPIIALTEQDFVAQTTIDHRIVHQFLRQLQHQLVQHDESDNAHTSLSHPSLSIAKNA